MSHSKEMMMNKFVFLDIDDVLLPWDFPNIKSLIDHSDFRNWQKVKHPYMNHVSYELLNLVVDSFSEHIYWLTTWELGAQGANKMFCETLGLPKFKEIPFIDAYYNKLRSGLWLANEEKNYWWKSQILHQFITELPDTNWKAVWIDNEIDDQIRKDNVHELLDGHPQIKLVSPYPCLTRAQILEAKEWLDNE